MTEVAVGVLMQPDGRYLLAQRPEGKPYEGYWEFPGGKMEAGESVEAALARELHEELGIDVTACERWRTLEHDYPHAYVRLYFCKVTHWSGEPPAAKVRRSRGSTCRPTSRRCCRRPFPCWNGLRLRICDLDARRERVPRASLIQVRRASRSSAAFPAALPADLVLLGRPGAEIDLLAAVRAKRAEAVFRDPADILAAGRAFDDGGHSVRALSETVARFRT